jgi:hypothetical protein
LSKALYATSMFAVVGVGAAGIWLFQPKWVTDDPRPSGFSGDSACVARSDGVRYRVPVSVPNVHYHPVWFSPYVIQFRGGASLQVDSVPDCTKYARREMAEMKFNRSVSYRSPAGPYRIQRQAGGYELTLAGGDAYDFPRDAAFYSGLYVDLFPGAKLVARIVSDDSRYTVTTYHYATAERRQYEFDAHEMFRRHPGGFQVLPSR